MVPLYPTYGPACSSEIWLSVYQTTWRHIPERHNLHTQSGKNLNPHTPLLNSYRCLKAWFLLNIRRQASWTSHLDFYKALSFLSVCREIYSVHSSHKSHFINITGYLCISLNSQITVWAIPISFRKFLPPWRLNIILWLFSDLEHLLFGISNGLHYYSVQAKFAKLLPLVDTQIYSSFIQRNCHTE
jgi:hypothetical protein